MKIIAIALATSLALGGSVARAEEGTSERIEEPQPPKRYPPSSVRTRLIAGGLGITAAAYAASFAAASAWPDVPGVSRLKIPVAGPWIALAENGCPGGQSSCGAMLYVRGVLAVLDGLVQIGGLGLVTEGIVMTTEARAAQPPKPALTLRPLPIVTATAAGLGVAGTF